MSEMKLMTLAAQQHYDKKIKGFIAEEDAKLLDKIETHVHSWNDLEDKPFGEEMATKVLFDGATTLMEDGIGRCEGYISPVGEVVPIEKCMTLHVEGIISDPDPESEEQENISSYATITGVNARFQTETFGQISIQARNNRYYISTSKNWGCYELTLKAVGEVTEAKALDEKYIPDTIARVSDVENIDLTPYETKTDAAAKLEEARAFASEEDAKIQAAVDTLSGKVTTLVGEDANKSVRTIANEELAKQLVAEGAKESLNTLTEIAAWIQSHPDDASAMNKAISDLEALVGALPDGVTATTVIGYVQEVVAANKALIDANTEAIGALHTVATSGSWNDLEDKPFGEAVEKKIILPEGEYPNRYYIQGFEPKGDDKYTVVYDGTQHTLFVNEGYAGGVPVCSFGNKGLIWPDDYDNNGFPFCVGHDPTYGDPLLVFADGEAHTVEIYANIIDTKTIDEKYIPDTIARVSDFCEVANAEIDAMFA